MGPVTERMTEHYSHVRMEEKASAAARVCASSIPRGTRRRNEKRPVELRL